MYLIVSLCLIKEEQRPNREASWAASDLSLSMVQTLTWRREPRWHQAWAPAVLATAADPAACATTEAAALRRTMATFVTAHSPPMGVPPATKVSPACCVCKQQLRRLILLINYCWLQQTENPSLSGLFYYWEPIKTQARHGTINTCLDCRMQEHLKCIRTNYLLLYVSISGVHREKRSRLNKQHYDQVKTK